MMRWTLLLSFTLAACDDGGGGGPADAGPDLGPDLGAGAGPACVPALADLTPNDPDCPNPLPSSPDRLDEALAAAGLDRCEAVYTDSEWNYWGGSHDDSFRLAHFATVHDAPLRSPAWAHETASALDAPAYPAASAIHLAAHRLGHGGAEECVDAQPANATLAEALASLRTAFGEPTNAADLEDELDGVPADLDAALAPIVGAMETAAKARDTAVEAWGGSLADLYDTIYTFILAHPGGQFLTLDSTVSAFLAEDFDAALLYESATRLALTIEAADLGRFSGVGGFDVDIATAIGRVRLRGAGNHTYEPSAPDEAYALIVDTGGNDTYRVAAGATTTVDARVAVAIDLSGDDTYGYPENPDIYDGARLVSDESGRVPCHPSVAGAGCSVSIHGRQGAARLGVGMLFDLGGGNDQYRSLRMSQGFGALGVGVLLDDGGDDDYAMEAGGQGAALFGIGLLLDQGGVDRYASYTLSQGFGFVAGMGALRDGGDGNDVYFCDPGDPNVGGDPVYQSAQLTCSTTDNCGNNAFCQGAGFGRRDDFNGCATCMSGGIGVLRDNGGDDAYTAGVFAQATGYWFGTGILDDEAGDDTYDGLWYVQGSTAHFALAVFRDASGNDRYDEDFPIRATSIGVGHDYSTSVHLDLGGNDLYDAPGLSLGAGNDEGHGYLFNVGGDDTYIVPGEDRTLGGTSPGTGRPAKNVGIFLDVGGTDTYTVPGTPLLTRGDNLTWIADGDDGDALHACGLDQATGQLTLPEP